MTASETKKSLKDLLNKKFLVHDASNYPELEWASTGLVNLDKTLGGGFPRGRFIQLRGEKATGKSSLAFKVLQTQQRLGKACVYIDLEMTVTENDFVRLGLNGPGTEDNPILLIQASNGSEAAEVAIQIMEAEEQPVIVIDSIPFMLPRAKLEDISNDVDKGNVASVAQFLTRVLPMLNEKVARSNAVVIFINQRRTNIGGYGNPETYMGGHFLEHILSVDLRLSAPKADKDAKSKRSTVAVKKNKVGPDLRSCELDLFLMPEGDRPAGFDSISALVEQAIAEGVLTRAGAWYSLAGEYLEELGLEPNKGDKFGFGAAGFSVVADFLRQNNKVYNKLYQLLVSK